MLRRPSDCISAFVTVKDLDAHETTEGLLQFGEPTPPPPTPTPPPPPPPDPKPQSPHSSTSPPRQKPQYLNRAPTGQRGRSKGQRGAIGRGQMFEDPAVMRTVEGRPSLKVMHINLSERWKSKQFIFILVFFSFKESRQCHCGLWECHVPESLWCWCEFYNPSSGFIYFVCVFLVFFFL